MMMKLKVKKLHEDAILPTYGSAGAGCFDLYAVVSPLCNEADCAIDPGEAAHVGTGLSFEVPDGWCMKIYSRSGHGFKHGIRLVNGAAVIDADYRGQVVIGLHNDGDQPFTIRHGDRIAQAELQPVQRIEFELVDELSDTARGSGGFGSTGA